jgi:hypothetical protein
MADNKNSIFESNNLFSIGENKGQGLFGSKNNTNSFFGGSLFGNKVQENKGFNLNNNTNLFGKQIEKEEKKVEENNQSLFNNNSTLFNFNIQPKDDINKNSERNNNNENNKQVNSLFFKNGTQSSKINANISNFGNPHKNIMVNRIDIKNEENEENNDENEEEEEEEIKKEEKDNKDDKEKIEEKKVSEELNKPDELKSVDDREYLDLINKKIKYYKNELDSSVNKIEENKKELITQEKNLIILKI